MALPLQIVSDELDLLELKIKNLTTTINDLYGKMDISKLSEDLKLFKNQFKALKAYLNTIARFV